MDEKNWLAEKFEENRSHLRAVAYRVLGSASEADDAVQEAWLRLSQSAASEIENLGGWLTTVVARVCLDMLRSRLSRRPVDRQPAAGGRAHRREQQLPGCRGLGHPEHRPQRERAAHHPLRDRCLRLPRRQQPVGW